MKEKYLQDISEIKNMMNKSSQFLSLSGLAGILAGLYAIIGAYIVNRLIANHQGYYITLESDTFKKILFVALAVLVLSIGTAVVLTYKKAKINSEKMFSATAKSMLFSFLMPLGTGGIFGVLLLRHQVYGLIAPVTLIFYGLACVNASKYTFRDVYYLGISLILLGLLATEFVGFALHFWAVGFGFFHIVYGGMMYFKYDKKKN